MIASFLHSRLAATPELRIGGDSVAVVGSAAAVRPAEWDAIARRGFHLHRWFEVLEESGWTPRHLGVRGPLGLRAIIPTYLVTGTETWSDLHSRWLGPVAGIAPWVGLRLRPTLSVMAPMAMTSDPVGDAGALPDPVLEQVFDALEEQALRDRARAVVWPFLDAGLAGVRRVARRRGYREIYSGASAGLAVEWGSFEEYVGSRSKSVRRTVRADLKAVEAAGLRLTAVADFRDLTGAVDALYRAAYRRRNDRDARLAADFFRRLAATPSADVWAQLTWRGDRLVGASVNLSAGGTMDGTLTAFAPEARGGPAYYNDLVYEPIRIACRTGAHRLDLGATALYPKVLRGARLRRQVTLVRGTNPAMRTLLAGLGCVVDRRNHQKERRALGRLDAGDLFETGPADGDAGTP